MNSSWFEAGQKTAGVQLSATQPRDMYDFTTTCKLRKVKEIVGGRTGAVNKQQARMHARTPRHQAGLPTRAVRNRLHLTLRVSLFTWLLAV